MPALVAAPVATETVIFTFGGTVNVAGTQVNDGEQPEGNVTLSNDGKVLYGRTYIGGADGLGTIFSVNIDGTNYQLLHSFSGQPGDGSEPRHNSMALSPDGSTLYGMAHEGGDGKSPGNGIIFSYDLTNTTPDAYQVVYSWQGAPDGATPHGSVILAGSTMYGMTEDGGDNHNNGVLFEMPVPINGQQTSDAPTILYNFGNGSADGAKPHGTPILVNGILYGMTREGGDQGYGVLFKWDPSQKGDASQGMTILHSFNGKHVASGEPPDGATPYHGNPLFYDNALYGMTTEGGLDSSGKPSDSSGDGIIFRYDLDPSDKTPYQVLHYFRGGFNGGANPDGSLTLVNNKLYGVTTAGGANGESKGDGDGTFFSINPDGSDYTVLYSFHKKTGYHPIDSLTPLVHPDGRVTFYGMTQDGGITSAFTPNPKGTIFAITIPPALTGIVPLPSSGAPPTTPAAPASTAINLTQIQVTPGLSGETVLLTAQVAGPNGAVHEGVVTFGMAGQTATAAVSGNGEAVAVLNLPMLTTAQTQTIRVSYGDPKGNLTASTTAATIPFTPIDAFLPSTTRLDSNRSQTITDTLFSIFSLTRSYNAQGLLTEIDFDGVPVAIFTYSGAGQLTSVFSLDFVDMFL